MKLFSAIAASACLLPMLNIALGNQLSPEELVKKQCRSVHAVQFGFPENTTAIYSEARAKKTANGTYFCEACMKTIYFGFQEWSNGQHAVIFSVWDPLSDPFDGAARPDQIKEGNQAACLAKGEGVDTSRFGGEGTGGKSMYLYDWKIDEIMRFIVIKKPVNEHFADITGYFYDNHKQKWILLSSWRSHNNKQEFFEPGSFIEDFRRNYDSTKNVRSATFGPMFAYTTDKKWVKPKAVGFSGDGTPSTNIRLEWHANDKAFQLQTGGDTQMGDIKLWNRVPYPQEEIHPTPGKEVEEIIEAALNK